MPCATSLLTRFSKKNRGLWISSLFFFKKKSTKEGINMQYSMVATWRMAYEGMCLAKQELESGKPLDEAVINAICAVEDNPLFNSVGNGGLPNVQGQVELDAAFMDGSTLAFGGVMALKNVKNPIKVAKLLSSYARNSLLCGDGAQQFAQEHGFAFANHLSPMSKSKWQQALSEQLEATRMEAYDESSHDTVCVLGYDGSSKRLIAATSTSGLFLKSAGRVGDSAIIGSGFYACPQGAAAATGVGEDIMKGLVSMRIVQLLADGTLVQQACQQVVLEHTAYLKKIQGNCGSISVIALDHHGNLGAATNKPEFPFVAFNQHQLPTVLLCTNTKGTIHISPAPISWEANYQTLLAKGSGT
jgi:L-asparaginase / beta-aspartyl-peptidase